MNIRKSLLKNQKFIRVKETKALGLGRIPRTISYNDFLPLNDIWQGYMDELIGDEYLRYVSRSDRCYTKRLACPSLSQNRLRKLNLKGNVSQGINVYDHMP